MKYECSSIWNSKARLPLLRTLSIVCSEPLRRVTLYVNAKSKGQACWKESLRLLCERPKSSVIESSPPLAKAPDSEDDLPKYSQVEFLAKPCCGSLPVACSFGGGPKTCSSQQSLQLRDISAYRENDWYASSYRLAAIKLSSLTHEHILMSI